MWCSDKARAVVTVLLFFHAVYLPSLINILNFYDWIDSLLLLRSLQLDNVSECTDYSLISLAPIPGLLNIITSTVIYSALTSIKKFSMCKSVCQPGSYNQIHFLSLLSFIIKLHSTVCPSCYGQHCMSMLLSSSSVGYR